MNEPLVFNPWPKIPRTNKVNVFAVVTEKLDGTNASVLIDDLGNFVTAGSRKQWITPDNDNYGFARWATENRKELEKLGPGHHFGEWYGLGIQKNPLGLFDKRFALFNTSRWSNPEDRPTCCECVTVFNTGFYSQEFVDECAKMLEEHGSFHVPDSKGKPEGLVVYLPAFDAMAKWTFDYKEGKWTGNV